MLDDTVKQMAQAANFAALTTLLPSGMPQTHVMWVDADDEHVLINTELHRQKYKNVTREPRVAVAIIDRDNPYRFAEVRGEVVERITGAEARAHIDKLSEKYTGAAYNPDAIQTERVILKIKPSRQIAR